jgi:hypothetical protein
MLGGIYYQLFGTYTGMPSQRGRLLHRQQPLVWGTSSDIVYPVDLEAERERCASVFGDSGNYGDRTERRVSTIQPCDSPGDCRLNWSRVSSAKPFTIIRSNRLSNLIRTADSPGPRSPSPIWRRYIHIMAPNRYRTLATSFRRH